MEVAIDDAGSSLAVGRPQVRFEMNPVSSVNPNFDVTPDGERFIVNGAVAGRETPPLSLVLNWPEAAPGR